MLEVLELDLLNASQAKFTPASNGLLITFFTFLEFHGKNFYNPFLLYLL